MVIYLVVFIFILADIVTGFLKAWYKGNVDSTVLRKGLFHKGSEIAACGVADMVQYFGEYVHINIGLPLASVIAGYICVMETISIIENLCAINPKMSKLFKPYLEKIKKG